MVKFNVSHLLVKKQFLCHGSFQYNMCLLYLVLLLYFRDIMDIVNFSFNLLTATNILPFLDLLRVKSVTNVVNINCNYGETIFWQKVLNSYNIKVATFKYQNEYTCELSYNYHKIAIILNNTCDGWEQAFNIFKGNSAFQNPYIWLVYTEDIDSTVNYLSNKHIEIDSDLTILLKTQTNYFRLFEAYHTDYSKGKLTVRQIGVWNKTLQLNNMSRRDISGLIMKCPVMVSDKLVDETFKEYLSTPRGNKVDSMHKLKFLVLLNYIGEMHNISYDFQRTNSWGYTRNGSFDGEVGALQRSEADIGGSPLFFRADRALFVDYVAETWTSRQCFILRHPKHPGGFYTIYTRPLTANVWYCVLILLALSGVILCVMLKVKIPKGDDGPVDSSLSLALLFNWSAICQQGMTVDKNSTSVKVVVLVVFIYAVTLYQYYNATVVSTLLREPPKNIRTLNDLLRSNLRAGAEDVLYTKDYFKRTTDQVAIKIYQKKIMSDSQSNFYSAERGMALVKKGGFAFHVDTSVAYRIMRSTFTERQVCEAHEVVLYPLQKMGLVLRKSSPYKKYFTYGVRKMFEAGIMHRLRAVWDEPKPACVQTPDSSIFSVSIREFSTALLALATGMITSLFMLVGEIITFKLKGNKCVPRKK